MKNIVIHFSLIVMIGLSSAFAQDEIAILAKNFGKLPEIGSVDISPDGTKILMMQNYDGRKILVTSALDDPNGERNGIPPLENQEYVWARFASNDRIIAGVKFPEVENYAGLFTWKIYETRLISMRWDGEDPVNPINPNPNRSRQSQIQDRVVDVMFDDPDHILISLDYEERGENRVYKIDITKTRNPVFVSRDNRYVYRWRADENMK